MNCALLLVLIILCPNTLSAAAHDAVPDPFEIICAVSSKRATLMRLERGPRELYLNMDTGDGTFAFESISLKENSLYIDGKCILDKISLFVSGGSPQDSAKKGGYEYHSAVRFFTATARYTHHRKLKAITQHLSDSELLAQELKERQTLQSFENIRVVVDRLEQGPAPATLIIDLAAWLTYCFGNDWGTLLPVKRVSVSSLPLSWRLYYPLQKYADLTQKDLEKFLAT